ncbi:MAG: enoyl-CoA hydratase/isomerase family protein [Chloroflexota bacterium]
MSLMQITINKGIAQLTLDNPPLNVVTVDLTQQISDTLDDLAADPNVQVLVLTGAGDRVFCAGSDIKEFTAFIGPEGRVLERKLIAENAMYSKLNKFPKPTIAALNGHALGGGLEMAVCCDLLVVSETARLSLPEVNLGVIPGSGGTIRVTRRIGEGRAKEMMLLGEPIDAQKALDWGLVNRVVPTDQVLETALELAAKLAALPNLALQCCKKSIDLSFDTTDDDAIQQTLSLSEIVFQSDDASEGARAFFAKEKPTFKHS